MHSNLYSIRIDDPMFLTLIIILVIEYNIFNQTLIRDKTEAQMKRINILWKDLIPKYALFLRNRKDQVIVKFPIYKLVLCQINKYMCIQITYHYLIVFLWP